jgi:hypothetical protein
VVTEEVQDEADGVVEVEAVVVEVEVVVVEEEEDEHFESVVRFYEMHCLVAIYSWHC